MHSSRMRTARQVTAGRSLSKGWVSVQGISTETHPWRMTDASKNIALPQTSFAGGKKQSTKTFVIMH